MKAMQSFHQEMLFAWAVLRLQDENLKGQLQRILDYAYSKMREGVSPAKFFPDLADAVWLLRLQIIRWAYQRGLNINDDMPDMLAWLDELKTDAFAVELLVSIQDAMEISQRTVTYLLESTEAGEEVHRIPEELFSLQYNQLREIVQLIETSNRSSVILTTLDSSLALELSSLIGVGIYEQQISLPSSQISDLTTFIRVQTSLYSTAANLLIDRVSQEMGKQLTTANQWQLFVDQMFGCMADAPISRFDEGGYETRLEFL